MADAHFEVYNADSSLQIDLGSKSLKLLAIQSTGAANGSYSNPAITSAAVVASDYSPQAQDASVSIAASQGVVNWTFGAVGTRQNIAFRVLVP